MARRTTTMGCLPAYPPEPPASGAEEEEEGANSPRNHHQHHHLTYPSLSLSPRLVNELVIDSMNWNPNLSLPLSLILFRRFIDLLW